MENKTESYIVLKPIAERFARVANEITDDEIKALIKSEMSNQIKTIDFKGWVGSILSDWVDSNEDTIQNLAAGCLKAKLQQIAGFMMIIDDIRDAIKHFDGLQKRYEKQHNGVQCKLVKTALSALHSELMREQGCLLCYGNIPNNVTGQYGNTYCPNCGRNLRVEKMVK